MNVGTLLLLGLNFLISKMGATATIASPQSEVRVMQWDRQPTLLEHSRNSKICLVGPLGACPPHLAFWCLPFIVCKLVSVVIGGDDVHEENVFCFRIKASHLHFITGKHPPRREGGGRRERKGALKPIF